MEHIFSDQRWELFFGAVILFLSFIGILGYIPLALIKNMYFLLLFFLGVMLGSMLILASIENYFNHIKPKRKHKRKKR